jgi:hypothetical protein
VLARLVAGPGWRIRSMKAPCEVRVEAVTGIFGERVPLTQGSNGVGHGADPQAELERITQPLPHGSR